MLLPKKSAHPVISLTILGLAFIMLLGLSGCAATKDLSHQPQSCQLNKRTGVVKDQPPGVYRPASSQAQSLNCQPLTLTDVGLVPGEHLLSINAGDSSRWLFQTMISDTDSQAVTHVLIKPTDSNLKTNVILATSQRTYHLNLTSDTTAAPTASVVFYDPLDNISQDSSSASKDPCSKLDKHYRLKNQSGWFSPWPNWAPTSIYNDGQKVIIQLPPIPSLIAPAFYVLDENQQPVIVNYTVQNNTYCVDQLFGKALLVKGVGSQQQKILIERLPQGKSR